jgi:glycosyltransferase involved in cell wall biosynthesis
MIIACFASVAWDDLCSRHQQIMHRLARRGHTIVYVEPTNILEAIKKGPRIFYQRIVSLDNVILVRPLFLVMHRKFKLAERFDRIVTAWLLRRVLLKLGRKKFDVTWLSTPSRNFAVPVNLSNLLVYDCNDQWEEFYTDETRRRWILKHETESLRNADVVFVTAKQLLKKCRAINSNVYLVTNGVPSSFFRTVHHVPHDIAVIKPPIVGFIGSIADWLDFDLLRSLASKNSDLSFLFIGPIQSRSTALAAFKALKALNNVFFLDEKRHDELPEYINNFNVGLIPFKVNALTQSVNPIKLFEYLAAGVPVVSSPLEEVLEFSDIVYVAENHDFSEKIRIAMNSDTNESRETRKAAAQQYTWDNIVARIESIIISKLEQKASAIKQLD